MRIIQVVSVLHFFSYFVSCVPLSGESIDAICGNTGSSSLFPSVDEYNRLLFSACKQSPECTSILPAAHLDSFLHLLDILYADNLLYDHLCSSRDSLENTIISFTIKMLVRIAHSRPVCPINHEFIKSADQISTSIGNNLVFPSLIGGGFCRCKGNLVCSSSHYRDGIIRWLIGIAIASFLIILAYMAWVANKMQRSLISKMGNSDAWILVAGTEETL